MQHPSDIIYSRSVLTIHYKKKKEYRLFTSVLPTNTIMWLYIRYCVFLLVNLWSLIWISALENIYQTTNDFSWTKLRSNCSCWFHCYLPWSCKLLFPLNQSLYISQSQISSSFRPKKNILLFINFRLINWFSLMRMCIQKEPVLLKIYQNQLLTLGFVWKILIILNSLLTRLIMNIT